MNSSEIIKNLQIYAKDVLKDFLNNSGAILYSTVSTLRKGEYMIVGLNPGGEHKETTLGNSIESMTDYQCNAYLDENWGYGIGNHRMQRNLKALAEFLNLDLRDICSTNLIFFRSKNDKGINYPIDADLCWNVNSKILEIVQPNVIFVIGNSRFSAFAYLNQLAEIEERCSLHIEEAPSGHGSWKLRSFEGTILKKSRLVIGLPHLSRYSLVHRDEQLRWIRSKIKKFADR